MGRKKKKFKPIIFCYYCDRTFENEKVLIQHQRAKHFKCVVCHKRLGSAHGMMVHVFQVHKQQIDKVPHAKEGRDSFQVDIFGMSNIPQDVIDEKHAERGEPPAKRQRTDNQQNPLIVNNVNIPRQPTNPMFPNPMMMNPMMNPMMMNPMMMNPMFGKPPNMPPFPPTHPNANMRPGMPPHPPFNPYMQRPPNMPQMPPPNMHQHPPNMPHPPFMQPNPMMNGANPMYPIPPQPANQPTKTDPNTEKLEQKQENKQNTETEPQNQTNVTTKKNNKKHHLVYSDEQISMEEARFLNSMYHWSPNEENGGNEKQNGNKTEENQSMNVDQNEDIDLNNNHGNQMKENMNQKNNDNENENEDIDLHHNQQNNV